MVEQPLAAPLDQVGFQCSDAPHGRGCCTQGKARRPAAEGLWLEKSKHFELFVGVVLMEETIAIEKRGFLRRVGIGLLNLHTPGLGLIRLGRYRLGLAIAVFSLAILPTTIFLCALLPNQTYDAFMPLAVFGFALLTCCVVASIVLSWRASPQIHHRQGPFWRWYSILGLVVIFSVVSNHLWKHVIDRNYRNLVVVAESMGPTLFEGDRLVAKMSDYFEISRGDVVVTVDEVGDTSQTFSIRRVAAIPGDTFSMKKGVVFINNKPVTLQPLPDIERDHRGNKFVAKRFREQLPGEASGHEILEIEESDYDNFADVKLGENQYFLLGDNRDNSTDSRFDRERMGGPGIINRSQIKGRALFRYWRTGVGLQEGKL